MFFLRRLRFGTGIELVARDSFAKRKVLARKRGCVIESPTLRAEKFVKKKLAKSAATPIIISQITKKTIKPGLTVFCSQSSLISL